MASEEYRAGTGPESSIPSERRLGSRLGCSPFVEHVSARHRPEPQQLNRYSSDGKPAPRGEARQHRERRYYDQGSGEEQEASGNFQVFTPLNHAS
jgi:hypothetical protein